MIITVLKNNKEKLVDVVYIIIPLTFFCSIKIFNSVVIIFSIIVITHLLFDSKQIKEKDWRKIFILIIPFIIVFYGFMLDVFHRNSENGWSSLETFLPIVFFPLLIAASGVTYKRLELSKLSFFIGCVIAAVICIGFAFWKNIVYHEEFVYNWSHVESLRFYKDNPIGIINWGFFLYTEFANSISFHPTYLSIYFIIGIIFSIHFLRRSIALNIFIVSGMMLLIAEIFLLSSKMSLAIFLIASFLTIFYIAHHFKRPIQRLILGCLLIFILTLTAVFSTNVYRVKMLVTDLKSNNITENDAPLTSLHRLYLWKNAIELFQKEPLIGYGLFGSTDALRKVSASNNTMYFNTHNQYLMLLLTAGIFGLLLFLITHFILIASSIRSGNYIYTFFLVIIMLGLLTENLLSRHTGVVLYAFFNTLFFIHHSHQKNEKV